MAESFDHGTPIYEIRVFSDLLRRLVPVPLDPDKDILGVSLDEEAGMASQVQITLNIWDAVANTYVIGNDPDVLQHGTSFELWSGYGTIDQCHGKFTIRSRDPSYPAGGQPTMVITAFGGLEKLMHNKQGFVFEATLSEAPPIAAMAATAGMLVDLDPKLLVAPLGDRCKRHGTTDLEYLKTVAMAYGLAMPHVSYIPNPAGVDFGVETLAMKTIRWQEALPGGVPNFLTGHGQLLRYMGGDDTGGELTDFDTSFDTSDLPVAVEVIGRGEDGKLVAVTVIATEAGPVVQSIAPVLPGPMKPQTPGLDAGEVYAIGLLGAGGQAIDTGVRFRDSKSQKIKGKRFVQELLYQTSAKATGDVVGFAMAWMAARMDAFWLGRGSVTNIQGAHRLGLNQVHRVAGVLPQDEGWWLFVRVGHAWQGGTHDVSFDAQKLLVLAAGGTP